MAGRGTPPTASALRPAVTARRVYRACGALAVRNSGRPEKVPPRSAFLPPRDEDGVVRQLRAPACLPGGNDGP